MVLRLLLLRSGGLLGCILALFGLLRSAARWAPGAFFVWLSVFNLFVVSVFWSFMADIWREAQARRLSGLITASGSAGALAGPALTAALAPRVGPVNLLPVAAMPLAVVWLAVAVFLGRRQAHLRRRLETGSAGGTGGG